MFVVPIFKEHHRLFKKTKNNPMGEDSLRLKLEQIKTLLKNRLDFNWKIIFTDDGDVVFKSGRLLLAHLQEHYSKYLNDGKVEVRFLEDLNPEWVKKSQKGGAIIATIQNLALQPDDIVIYTDADVSSDLRLAGTLIRKIEEKECDVAIFSRWLQGSTVVNRGFTAKLSSFIYNVIVFLFLGISLTDTQNGFKAFRFEAAKHIFEYCSDIRFSFDTEVLMIAKLFKYKVKEVPTYWQDSSEESTVDLRRDAFEMIKAVYSQRKKRNI